MSGFRDTTIYRGVRVELYKRAQILVGDLWAAYDRPHDSCNPYAFGDIDKLTMFADYRVPQILREFHVLLYDSSLARRVDFLEEIPFGSEEETEIRAATIIAVDLIHAELCRQGSSILVIEVDWLLWQAGEQQKQRYRPHHRTKTIYY